MRIKPISADANGRFSLPSGVGFMLEPAGDSPGGFPVTIKYDRGAGDEITYGSVRPIWPKKSFQSVEVEGARANSTWLAYVFDELGEEVGPSSGKTRRTKNLQARAEVGVAVPAGATDGVEILPAYKSLQLLFDGTARDVDMYYRSIAGNWRYVETFAAADMPTVFGRLVAFGGGRLAFKAAGAACMLEIDVEVENG